MKTSRIGLSHQGLKAMDMCVCVCTYSCLDSWSTAAGPGDSSEDPWDNSISASACGEEE